MLTFFADQHVQHDCAGEIKDGRFAPCFENPRRLENVRLALLEQNWGPLLTPESFDLAPILRVHGQAYVQFLQGAYGLWQQAGRKGDILPLSWPGTRMRTDWMPRNIDGRVGLYAFDSGTPICAGTWAAAKQGAEAALSGANALCAKQTGLAFAASRPPGHHAMQSQYGGYCFLNNAAIGAQYMIDQGASRIAILDVDYHHGNGTQDIFYQHNDVLVVNLHADPADEYPFYLGYADETGEGAGEGANLNLPMPSGTDWSSFRDALARAITAIRNFSPDFLVISYGADTFEADPLGKFRLTAEDYLRLGEAVAKLALPSLVVLEGGYAIEHLGLNVVNLLKGLQA